MDRVLDGEQQVSSKSYTTAVFLSAVFGVIGIHHFYCDRWLIGLFDLGLFVLSIVLFLTGYPLWAVFFMVIDAIHTVIVTYLLFVGKYRDGDGYLITYPGQKI